MKPIARIRSDFATKFGIPRQSGVVGSLQAEIVFEPEFRSREAVRGLDGYSHIWLIWEFSENVRAGWSPTVRPPRLGGNVRMGVFATRSPFRPNPIGLSCVRLERIEFSDARGPVLHVAGADLMDGTPIYDIKPYIPYADCRPEATEGFTGQIEMQALTVEIPPELLSRFPVEKRDALIGVLAQDPRPRYQTDASRVYGLEFGGYEVKFSVNGQKMTVTDIIKRLVKSRVFFIFQLIQVGAPRALGPGSAHERHPSRQGQCHRSAARALLVPVPVHVPTGRTRASAHRKHSPLSHPVPEHSPRQSTGYPAPARETAAPSAPGRLSC